MVEAMTEIQGRADAMMEEIKAREVSVMCVFIFSCYSSHGMIQDGR